MNISIIIPVYNVEHYIEKCLLSCLRQDIPLSDYEIIVINDGSPDNSLTIIERIATSINNNNIKIISQSNKGLSAARNKGLSMAQGKYVWFIDSDDWIEENCLGRICSQLDNNVDILQLQYRKVYENGRSNVSVPFYNIDGIKNGQEIISQGGLPAPAQFSIYRTEFLRNNYLKFYEGILHEDSEFKPRVTYLANRIASDTAVSYNYLQRKVGSITSAFKLRNATSILIVMNNIIKFVRKYNVEKDQKYYFYRMLGMNMNSLLIGYRQLNVCDRNYISEELKKNKHLFVYMMKSRNLKYIIEGFFFYLNPLIGFSFHKLFR